MDREINKGFFQMKNPIIVPILEGGENLLPRATVTTVARAATSPGGQAEAIVVDFGEVETGFVLETGGSVAS